MNVRKKIILFFIFSSIYGFLTPIFSEAVSEGYLGLSLGGEYIHSSQEISNIKNNASFFTSPISFIGVASDYYVFTKIEFFSDITRLVEIYSNDSSSLKENIVYPFSYFNFEIQYLIKQKKQISLLGGFNFGHEGVLSTVLNDYTYFLYVAPVFSVQWTINKLLMLRNKVLLTIPVYRSNLDTALLLESNLELILDPKGPVNNSKSDSILFSLGIKYNLLILEKELEEEVTYKNNSSFWTPYFKITLLY